MRATAIVHQALEKSLSSIHKSRLKAVFFAVEALVNGGKLSLTAMGRSARGAVAPKHSIKRVDRLLGNPHLHKNLEVFFRALTRLLLEGNKEPVILIDWTQIGEHRYSLSAAVPMDGRALPIYWEVHDEHLLSNRHIQMSFLATLTGLVPSGCCPVVVTDAGFTNHWFQAVLDMGWDYVGRLRGRVTLSYGGNPWQAVRTLYGEAGPKPKELGWGVVAKSNPIETRIVLAKAFKRNPLRPKARRRRSDRGRAMEAARKRAMEPWVLATSLAQGDEKAIIRIYAQRMQIEEVYRDAKNHRFGWSFRDAKATTDERYLVLLLIASLGMLALTLIGQTAESRGWHWGYQANTVRSRRVLSLFFLGKMYVDRQDLETFHAMDLKESLMRIRARICSLDVVITRENLGIP